MARPLRHTYKNAIYHIINRGSRRDRIFTCDGDKEQFISRMLLVAEECNVVFYSYCLMNNHFHLLVQTPEANISEAMRVLQGGYSNWFRAKYDLVGPLFQSRYKSVLVENEEYLVTLSAYIHLNPVRAGMVEKPESYKFSSAKQILGNRKSDLITPKTLLTYAGGIDNYRHILTEIQHNPPDREAIYGRNSILGGKQFRETLKRQIEERNRPQDVPEYRKLMKETAEKIERVICRYYNVPAERLNEPTWGNIPKKMYLYFLRKKSPLTIREIAGITDMKPVTTGALIRRFSREILRKTTLKKDKKKIEKLIEKQKEYIENETWSLYLEGT